MFKLITPYDNSFLVKITKLGKLIGQIIVFPNFKLKKQNLLSKLL